MGDVGSSRPVREIMAPLWPSVFDHGIRKEACSMPVIVVPNSMRTLLLTCLVGSYRLRLGTQSSEDLQMPWKAVVEALYTVASCAFDKSSPRRRQCMYSRVTRSLLTLCKELGASFETPFLVEVSIAPPSQGAPWKVCQNRKPANQLLIHSVDHFPM